MFLYIYMYIYQEVERVGNGGVHAGYPNLRYQNLTTRRTKTRHGSIFKRLEISHRHPKKIVGDW